MSLIVIARRTGLALAAAFLLAAPAAAQTAAAYEGDWAGVLSAGGQALHLVLQMKTEAGQLTAILDSVDQGASIPATAVKTDGGELSVLFLAVGGELKGKLSSDGKVLEGSWTQGPTVPLTLTKAAAK